MDRFAELADGRLAGESLKEIESHLDRCARCAAQAAELARLSQSGDAGKPWLTTHDRVDRYIIREWLGGGSMGQVFAADDPQLGRRVAIKLPRSAASGPARDRLLREAKAMARLTHPNVVAVHDAGIADGRPFIAMELVVGESLASWSAREHDWPEVLSRYIEAGRGLAAAHRAGLLHRDFKPANALIDEESRVLVTDFGLAAGAGIELVVHSDGASASDAAVDVDVDVDVEALAVTATGELIGTPAYMSPEQHAGEVATERSDQFSFAVSLFEALEGRRPFAGSNALEIAVSIAGGQIAALRSAAPPAVSRAIARALEADPARRWPSMDALLGELERASRHPRRRLVLAAVAAIAVVIAGLLWHWSAGAGDRALAALCGDPAAQASEAWSPQRRSAVAAAFAAVDLPYAVGNGEKVFAALDRYIDRWTLTRTEACEAHARGVESKEIFAERRACLDERLRSLASLADRMTQVDADSLDRMASAAHRLPAISECSAAGVLGHVTEPPPASARAEVTRIEAEQSTAEVLTKLGRFDEALTALEPLGPAATATGSSPLVAKIFLAQAAAHRLRKDFPAARASATKALAHAQASSYRAGAAKATAELALIGVADDKTDADELERWVELARAIVAPLEDQATLHADVAYIDAELAKAKGDPRAQLAANDRLIELKKEMYGTQSPELAKAMAGRASTLAQLGEPDEAIAALQKAAAILIGAYGEHHQSTMAVGLNLASALLMRERNEEAIDILRHQLVVRAAVYGESSAPIAAVRQNLAAAYRVTGQNEASLAEARAAVAALSAARGADHPQVAVATLNLGVFLTADEQPREAIEVIGGALSALEASLGADHPHVAQALMNLGQAHIENGDPTEAERALIRAHRIFHARLGADHPSTVAARHELGRARVDAGRVARGIRDLEAALAASGKLSSFGRAQLEMDLARALLAHRGDRVGARVHAESALKNATGRPETHGEIEAFLATL